ncbi:MAG: ROK family protein [Clostridia bacterium]|nr:ROK family protein [Clostridia bacterium]
MKDIYIGIDLGGTFIKSGIADADGKILSFYETPTECGQGVEHVAENISAAITRLFEDAKSNGFAVTGIGLSIPGFIDSANGTVIASDNIRWYGVPIKKMIAERFGNIPVSIENDANCAALGEALFGSGEKRKNCVLLTLGTGVGSGIIINGKIYSGNRSAGAEVGHIIIHPRGKKCTCGGRGCLETYASATALICETKKTVKKHPDSLMAEVGADKIDGKTAFDYREKDKYAAAIVKKYIDDLSIGLISIANIFRPEAIILGGGVAKQGESLTGPLNRKLKESIIYAHSGPEVPVICATVKEAGMLGAAALNMQF